jgi:phosphate transport system substrate-binding protein
LDDSVKGISIGGTPCTVENAVNGSYPIVRPLYFLTKLQPDGLVRKFIDYSQGPKGQATMAAAGFIAK